MFSCLIMFPKAETIAEKSGESGGRGTMATLAALELAKGWKFWVKLMGYPLNIP